MKLYLCTRVDGREDYDETWAMVVRAESYGAAKRLAMAKARGTHRESFRWKVARVRDEGTPGMVLEDYLAG